MLTHVYFYCLSVKPQDPWANRTPPKQVLPDQTQGQNGKSEMEKWHNFNMISRTIKAPARQRQQCDYGRFDSIKPLALSTRSFRGKFKAGMLLLVWFGLFPLTGSARYVYN